MIQPDILATRSGTIGCTGSLASRMLRPIRCRGGWRSSCGTAPPAMTRSGAYIRTRRRSSSLRIGRGSAPREGGRPAPYRGQQRGRQARNHVACAVVKHRHDRERDECRVQARARHVRHITGVCIGYFGLRIVRLAISSARLRAPHLRAARIKRTLTVLWLTPSSYALSLGLRP